MNEVYLLVIMFLSTVSGYFISKGAREELKEISPYLKYAYIITASIVFGIAAYFSLLFSVIIFLIISFLLYFYHDSNAQKAVLFVFGVLIFLVGETFIFSVVLFINLMIMTSMNYDKRFLRNISVYLYFLIPAVIVFILKLFL